MEVEEEVVEPAPEPVNEDAQFEDEARSMGWVPKGEFRGPEDKWRSAKEFVEHGQNFLPIANSLLKKERAKTSRLEGEMERLKVSFGRLEKMSELAVKKTEERIRAEYDARKEAAVERGDMDAYRAADKAEKVALADLDAKKEQADEKKGPELPVGVKEAVESWIDDNQWFKNDAELNAVANAIHEKLLRDKPGLSIEENLAAVRERVAEKYPEKFSLDDKPKARVSRVEGGSRTSGGGGSAYSKLPSDAKQACNGSAMGWKLYLKPGEDAEKHELVAKERWAKVYWDQPGVQQP
jgi:hypothetical protein